MSPLLDLCEVLSDFGQLSLLVSKKSAIHCFCRCCRAMTMILLFHRKAGWIVAWLFPIVPTFVWFCPLLANNSLFLQMLQLWQCCFVPPVSRIDESPIEGLYNYSNEQWEKTLTNFSSILFIIDQPFPFAFIRHDESDSKIFKQTTTKKWDIKYYLLWESSMVSWQDIWWLHLWLIVDWLYYVGYI